jgi:hypothetical protein
MAASSAKDKANSLKDSYVAGLIEGGATSPAPAMPTQDMGDTAGVLIDLQKGGILRKNDGNPRLVIRDGSRMRVEQHDAARMPNNGRGYGETSVSNLTPQLMNDFAGRLHSRDNSVDTIMDFGTTDQFYGSAMSQYPNR